MARKVVTWENIPQWAIYALEYGTGEDGSLNDEDGRLISDFISKNFPNGYCMSVRWDSYTSFCSFPAFGKACDTYTVDFLVDE